MERRAKQSSHKCFLAPFDMFCQIRAVVSPPSATDARCGMQNDAIQSGIVRMLNAREYALQTCSNTLGTFNLDSNPIRALDELESGYALLVWWYSVYYLDALICSIFIHPRSCTLNPCSIART